MSVKVSIPSAFRRHTEGLDYYECAGADLPGLLDSLGSRFPELKPHLRDEQGNVRRFLNIYVNDEDIRFLGKDYKFKEGDEVTLVPSIAGGKTPTTETQKHGETQRTDEAKTNGSWKNNESR